MNSRNRSAGLATLVLAASSAVSMPTATRADEARAANYGQVPESALSVVAEVQAKPGKEAELRAATLPLIDRVRSDPKTVLYFLQEDREKKGHFVFFEVFANEADFNAHNDKPYVKAWFAKLPELANGGIKTTKLVVLPAPGH